MRRAVAGGVLIAVALLNSACSSDGMGAAPTAVSTDPATTALAAAVDIRATGCRPAEVRGAGALIDGDHILTAAHVVAGADSITVRSASPDATAVTARVVAIDPLRDLALLDVERGELTELRPLHVAAGAVGAGGDTGSVVLFRDGAAVGVPYSIGRRVVVNILDIHHEHEVSRPGYEVDIAIAAGDSGAVMVAANRRAIGVLYAKSRAVDTRAFASDTGAVDALVAAASAVDPAVGIDTGECV